MKESKNVYNISTDDEDVRLMLLAYETFSEFEILTIDRLTAMRNRFDKYLREQ